MTKICIPNYRDGEFSSLKEAVSHFRDSMLYEFILTEIVFCNISYRDHLREHGLDSLKARLLEEAPELDEKPLKELDIWWERIGRLAAYDIQCYNIRDKITVLGHTFQGLEDVSRHCEIMGHEFFYSFDCFVPKEFEVYDDIHIGEVYDRYPTFDSYDLSDDRTYRNYIFRRHPVTEADMKEAFKVSHGCNFCMVHEDIPETQLPILYYKGDGNYMLLATAKE